MQSLLSRLADVAGLYGDGLSSCLAKVAVCKCRVEFKPVYALRLPSPKLLRQVCSSCEPDLSIGVKSIFPCITMYNKSISKNRLSQEQKTSLTSVANMIQKLRSFIKKRILELSLGEQTTKEVFQSVPMMIQRCSKAFQLTKRNYWR